MINLANIQAFTPAQMVAIIDNGIALCALNQEWSHQGKTFRKADIPRLIQARSFYLELQAIGVSGTGDLCANVQFGDPSYPNDQGAGSPF